MDRLSAQDLRLNPFGESRFTKGLMRLYHFSTAERVIRAAQFFLVFFILALISVLIPALHFVLVPLFAILAPTSAVVIFIQREQIREAFGECPYCQKQTRLSRPRTTFPFRDSCEHCRQLIEVFLAEK